MEKPVHSFAELFRQLGLPDDLESVDAFIARHRPLAGHLPLADAPFWTPAQSRLLCEGLADDADWSELVDALSARMR